MPFVLSGFADEYSADFTEQVSGFNKLGIKNIELRFADGVNVADFDDKKLKTVSEILKNGGISVSAIGSPIGKIDINGDFSEHLCKAERVFATANKLNCRYVRIFSFYLGNNNKKVVRGDVVKRLSVLIELADRYNVMLCHENEAGIYGESPEDCLDLLRAFEGKLRCVFDMGNFCLGNYDPLNAYFLLKDYIEYFHIKDATKSGEIVPCGEGCACIKNILIAFKKDFNDKRV